MPFSDVLCRHIKGHTQPNQRAPPITTSIEADNQLDTNSGRGIKQTRPSVNEVIFVAGPHSGSPLLRPREIPHKSQHEPANTVGQLQQTPISHGEQEGESEIHDSLPTDERGFGLSTGESSLPTMDIIMEDPSQAHSGPPRPIPWALKDHERTNSGQILTQNTLCSQTAQEIPCHDSAIDMLSFAASESAFDKAAWTFENGRSSPEFAAFQNPDISMQTDSVAEMLQTWLFQPSGGLFPQARSREPTVPNDQSQSQSQSFNRILSPGDSNGTMRRSTSAFKIPLDSFARVQKCWNPESARPDLLMPNLWQSLVNCSRDNLICVPTHEVEFEKFNLRRSRFDEGCRARIQRAIYGTAIDPGFNLLQTPASPAESNSGSSCSLHPEDIVLPPVDMFEVALDIYFGQFHPTLPIIHYATFDAANVPTPLLLAITLLGFSILGTTGATKFASQAFSVSFEGGMKVDIEHLEY